MLTLVIRALREVERRAGRWEAAVSVLRGRPVIFGAELEGPLKISSGRHLLISQCHIANGDSGLVFVPPAWSEDL